MEDATNDKSIIEDILESLNHISVCAYALNRENSRLTDDAVAMRKQMERLWYVLMSEREALKRPAGEIDADYIKALDATIDDIFDDMARLGIGVER